MSRNHSHLTLLRTRPDMTINEMYRMLFEMLADQHEAVAHAAEQLLQEAVDRGIDPAALDADGALLQLGLARIDDLFMYGETGTFAIEYEISPERRQVARVREALTGLPLLEDDDE